jgi:hypothetical protein
MAFACSPFIRVVAAALALIAAHAAHAVVYKWVEEDGKVIYSNEPPADPARVRELSRIDDLELVPTDTAAASTPEKGSAGAAASNSGGAWLSGEPVTLIPREPPKLRPREPVPMLSNESVSAQGEPPPRVFPRSTHTGAVQDPCLVSSDPRCYERNKAHYHPYAGYVPPSGAGPQAVGANGSAGGGGSVGGKIPAVAIEWSKPPR